MSRILFRNEKISGYTQRELADRWVVQNNSTSPTESPFSTNDLTDPRGRRGSLERHESFQLNSPEGVTFLGGSLVVDPQTGDPVPPAVRTIVGTANTTYYAPFINLFPDNTTDDPAEFGGYALTPRHFRALTEAGITPRDASDILGADPGSYKTLRDIAKFILDFAEGQSVAIDGVDMTPTQIRSLRHRTRNLSYADLPRATGEIYPLEKILADPDLATNLEDNDLNNDYPTIGDLNPNYEDQVVPFVQEGFYFAAELNPDVQNLKFGGSLEGLFGPTGIQEATYNFLNPIVGDAENNFLKGSRQNDLIDGDDGRDRLFGFAGDDLIVGGNGRDVLNGGQGDDELWGDAGLDRFIFGRGFGNDTIFDFEAGEKVILRNLSEFESISDVTLGSGLSAAQIQFNNKDILTLVGVESSALNVNLDSKMITQSEGLA